jgi:predicted permease
MLAELLTIMAPVLVCVGIGFGWARFGHHFDPELVTLLSFVTLPVLLVWLL